MSVEFRQRTASEYVKILWRRKWLILLPAIAIAISVAWVVRRLPNVFESTTLLAVRPATISSEVVPRLSDSDLSLRINGISQEVTSRTSLEPLIEKHNLYAAERSRGVPMELLIERMRVTDIRVAINTGREDVTNGFFLSFRGSDPLTTMRVTQELASKYVNAQTKAATEDSQQAQKFFEEQLQKAKEELDATDKQRLEFMMKNADSLPSISGSLLGQLGGLRDQQMALITDIGRMRDQYTTQSNLLADISKQRTQDIMDVAEQVGDPKSTPAYAQLRMRKTQLEAELQQLLTEYKPKHPDVVSKRSQIDLVQREMNEMIEDGKNKVAEKQKQLEGRVDIRITSYENSLRNLKSEIDRQQRLLAQTEAQIADIEHRINFVPSTDVSLQAITREFETKKGLYEGMLAQKKRAELAADVATSQRGESIGVLDSANLPSQPVAPNRPLLMLLGLGVGLGVGLLCAAVFEVPRLLTIQTKEDAEHYTGLPVLVSVPEMLTPREERRLKIRRATLAVAGVAITIIGIPALTLILKMSRVIEILAYRG